MKSKQWKPKEGEVYWGIYCDYKKPHILIVFDNYKPGDIHPIGNVYFPTRKQALKKLKAIKKVLYE